VAVAPTRIWAEETDEEDAALAARASDDPDALAALYRRHVAAIYRFCERRLGNRQAAEDATSAVFLKAIRGLPTFHPGLGSFRGWLFGIAHRTVIDAYRAARPAAPLEAAGEVVDHRPGHAPETMALHAEAAREVRAILLGLSAPQRAVVELRLAGLNGPEIAAVLGRSTGSVKLLQFRAYGRLRALLGADADQEDRHAP